MVDLKCNLAKTSKKIYMYENIWYNILIYNIMMYEKYNTLLYLLAVVLEKYVEKKA